MQNKVLGLGIQLNGRALAYRAPSVCSQGLQKQPSVSVKRVGPECSKKETTNEVHVGYMRIW